jgi:hypothetical protein
MTDAGELDTRFREFRERIRNVSEKSSREAELRLREEEGSLESSFRDGETGSFELALDYLDEVAQKSSPLSLNAIEEAYISLLLSYKRMKGNVSALGGSSRQCRRAPVWPLKRRYSRPPAWNSKDPYSRGASTISTVNSFGFDV